MFIRNNHHTKHTLESLRPILKEFLKKNQLCMKFKISDHMIGLFKKKTKKTQSLRFLRYGLVLCSSVLIKNSSKNPFKDL